VVKVFELAVARTGLRDAEAAAAGLDPVTVGSVEFDHKAYTLAEIEELLELSEHRRGTNELHQRAQAKVAEIDAKVDQLTQMRQMLVAVMAAECDSLTDCTCGAGLPAARVGDHRTRRRQWRPRLSRHGPVDPP
jgi:MerR, DNA binding